MQLAGNGALGAGPVVGGSDGLGHARTHDILLLILLLGRNEGVRTGGKDCLGGGVVQGR
jgi:hypothetical protein